MVCSFQCRHDLGSLVIFITVTSIIVGRLSGEIGHSLDKAEQALADKNEDFGELNEELKAIEEELRQNIDALSKTERDQRESELFLRETEKTANLAVGRQTRRPIIFW